MYVFLPVDPLIGVALNDVSATLLGFLPGNSSLDLEFRANAFPSSGTARIYKGRLTYKKTFLWVLPITRTIFNNDENSQSDDKFVDNYPGGIAPTAFAISESGGTTNWFYKYNYELNVNLNFNFISATSALDVGSDFTTLTNNDYFRTYTAANPPLGNRTIPFINFTTSSNQNNSLNAPHITFNRRNGDWLATELDNDQNNTDLFNCLGYCANAAIVGSDFLCTTGNYSVPQDATAANWSISQGANLVTLTNSNSLTATLTALNNTVKGYVTLNVIFGNAKCGGASESRTIYVGKPSISNYEITGSGTQYSVTPATGVTSYTWTIEPFSNNCANSNGLYPPSVILPKFNTGNGLVSTYTSASSMAFISWGNCPGIYLLNCKAVNACGFTSYNTKTINFGNYSGGGGGDPDPCIPGLAIYPNPVEDDEFTIELIPPTNPCIPTLERGTPEENYVRIYDFYGNEVYAKLFRTSHIKISGLQLKRGHYALNVFTASGQSKREIIIVK